MQQRKRLRLDGYDYATTGAYFATVVARRRACLFGNVVEDAVELSPNGVIVQLAAEGIGSFTLWGGTRRVRGHAQSRPCACVFVERSAPATSDLQAVVGAFKARASRRADRALCQRGYHDRIVRGERELEAFREYIETNPLRWALDPAEPRASADSTGRMDPAPTPLSPRSQRYGINSPCR